MAWLDGHGRLEAVSSDAARQCCVGSMSWGCSALEILGTEPPISILAFCTQPQRERRPDCETGPSAGRLLFLLPLNATHLLALCLVLLLCRSPLSALLSIFCSLTITLLAQRARQHFHSLRYLCVFVCFLSGPSLCSSYCHFFLPPRASARNSLCNSSTTTHRLDAQQRPTPQPLTVPDGH